MVDCTCIWWLWGRGFCPSQREKASFFEETSSNEQKKKVFYILIFFPNVVARNVCTLLVHGLYKFLFKTTPIYCFITCTSEILLSVFTKIITNQKALLFFMYVFQSLEALRYG